MDGWMDGLNKLRVHWLFILPALCTTFFQSLELLSRINIIEVMISGASCMHQVGVTIMNLQKLAQLPILTSDTMLSSHMCYGLRNPSYVLIDFCACVCMQKKKGRTIHLTRWCIHTCSKTDSI